MHGAVGDWRLTAEEPVVVLILVVQAGSEMLALGRRDHRRARDPGKPDASLGAVLHDDVHHTGPDVAVFGVEAAGQHRYLSDKDLIELRERLAREAVCSVYAVHRKPDLGRASASNFQLVAPGNAHAGLIAHEIEHRSDWSVRDASGVDRDQRRRNVPLDRRSLRCHDDGLHLDGFFTEAEVYRRGPIRPYFDVRHVDGPEPDHPGLKRVASRGHLKDQVTSIQVCRRAEPGTLNGNPCPGHGGPGFIRHCSRNLTRRACVDDA